MYCLVMLDNIKIGLQCVHNLTPIYLLLWVIAAVITMLITESKLWSNSFCWDCFKKAKWLHIFVGFIMIFTFFINILMPTTKQMAVIYIVPKVINNENLQELPTNVLNVMNKYLSDLADERVQEIKDTIKDGTNQIGDEVKDGVNQLKDKIKSGKDELVSEIKKKARSILNEENPNDNKIH